jgi:hypothetical protein
MQANSNIISANVLSGYQQANSITSSPHNTKKLLTYYIFRSTFKQRDSGSTVVKVLCYKSEGRWFDSRWCHWNFSLT